jgi:hypothetical protein
MFLLNDKPIGLDTAFTTENGTQYPSNWIRLASADERSAIGITEVADEDTSFDGRFYWSKGVAKALEDKLEVKIDGSPLMVQVYDDATEAMVDTDKQVVTKGLKSQMIAQVKASAGSMLAATDWKVVRAAEGIKAVDADTLAERSAIRAASDANEAAIVACTSIEALASLEMNWPVF